MCIISENMGGGGLMQLVAYGMQDVYLTGNSQITFFKNLYRRHTNFSVEAVEQTFQSNSDALGNRLVAVISRNGDLLHRLWLEVSLPEVPENADAVYTSKLGHQLIKSAEVEIGGQRIDKIYGRWMELWHQLSCRAEKKEGYELMTANNGEEKAGAHDTSTSAGTAGLKLKPGSHSTARKLYLPINFWFSKGSAGAALPLIALQYHEVRITIELATAGEISRKRATSTPFALSAVGSPAAKMLANPKLYSDFFYLDTDERRRFSQMSHEYLVEQLQFTGKETSPQITSSDTSTTSMSVRLNFNHPTKAIYFTAEPSGQVTEPNPFYNGYVKSNASVVPDDNSPFAKVGLMLNGHDRFSERDGSYFTWVQPYQHHTRVPTTHWTGMYSFCISPEEHQPSGALNFSRIDNAQLKLTFKGVDADKQPQDTRDVYVYALSYNVLRILSGMGGLAFSN
jgi:hypothetical protein